MVIGDGYSYTTSKQLKDYLLCERCEHEFHSRGENWVMANCFRDDKTFKIREMLQAAGPVNADPEIEIYSAGSIPQFEVKSLVYFAMSVFWRAAVHVWRVDGREYGISLGPYEEPLRRYLRGQSPFPDRMALIVRVPGKSELFPTAYPPQSNNQAGFHSHQFSIPGIVCLLLSGGRIPGEFFGASMAPAPECFILIDPRSDEDEIMRAVSLSKTSLRL